MGIAPRRGSIRCLVAALIGATLVCGGVATADAASVSMSGTLLEPSGSPAVGDYVQLENPDGTSVVDATTTDSGHWKIGDVAPGQYIVQFSSADLSNQTYAYGKYSSDTADVITVANKSVVVDDTIPVPLLVSGRIVDAVTKAPLANICASWFDPPDPSSGFGEDACTDADGVYQLEIPQPGNIAIRVEDSTGKYVNTVSSPFDIAAGQQITGKDFALSLGGTVSGLVLDRATGLPIANLCPSASFGRYGKEVINTAEDCSDAAGHWALHGLPATGVTIQLQGDQTHFALWVGNVLTQHDATVLQVKSDAEITAPTVRLRHGGVLAGKITDSAGHPVEGAWVELDVAPTRCGVPCGQYSGETAADGSYSITNIPPRRSIVSVSAEGQHLAATFSGGATDPGKATKISLHAETTTRYDAVMGPEARLKVTLHGVGTGDLAEIDTFPLSGVTFGFGGEVAAPGGTVVIDGLPAGSFRIQFSYDNDQKTIWYGGTTMEAKGKAVTLTAGKTTAITFTLP